MHKNKRSSCTAALAACAEDLNSAFMQVALSTILPALRFKGRVESIKVFAV